MPSLRIAILTDIHAAPADFPAVAWHDRFEPAKGADLARSAVAALNQRAFDIAFVLGDITNNGDDASLDQALAVLRDLNVPTWLVSGNHDLRVSEDALRRAIARNDGEMRIPDLPGERIDDLIVSGLRFEGLTDAVVSLIQAPVAGAWGDELVLLPSHYPIISRVEASAASGWKYAGDPKGLDGLANQLAARPGPTVSFHGHLHLDDAVARGAYLQIGFPALVENGHRAAIVEIERNDASVSVTIEPITTGDDGRPAATIGAPVRAWTFENGEWRG